MIKQITIFAFAAICLMACGGTSTNVTINANAANTTANAKPANTNTANANTNTNAAKPAESGPKRISFSKGADNTVENFDLEPDQSKKFVVGAKKGQDLTIADADQTAKITMLTKGKLVDINDKPGNYNATTIANGDIVFEISNPTKKKIKASINVMIITIGDD